MTFESLRGGYIVHYYISSANNLETINPKLFEFYSNALDNSMETLTTFMTASLLSYLNLDLFSCLNPITSDVITHLA